MLRGVDVSNWQPTFVPSQNSIEFCICKATEGTGFVDSYCDGFIQDCIANDIPWGFYHFAKGLDPDAEARFFIENTSNYFKHGIPVLDFEVDTYNNCEWCERFISTVHNLTGVYPMLYISAYRCAQYTHSWIPEKCGLWLAGYPNEAHTWAAGDIPYDFSPWKICAIWQFTSCLRLEYDGNLDGNIAYMDREGWKKYANSSYPSQTIDRYFNDQQMAEKVIRGEHGNGNDRKRELEQLGYDYDAVQAWVNRYYAIAKEVIAGKWGNGWNRKNALESVGYDYDTVQTIVNELLKG